MMPSSPEIFKPRGAGFAELPIPFFVRAALALAAIGASIFVLGGCAYLTERFFEGDWSWLLGGFDSKASAILSAWVAFAFASAILVYRLTALRNAFGLRVIENKWRYGGRLPFARTTAAVLLAVAFTALGAELLSKSWAAFPLPRELVRLEGNTTPAPSVRSTAPMPIYLWNYSAALEPSWFEHIRVVLPYEKGLPKKLLPKIYLEDRESHTLALELHGRRPRNYEPSELEALFRNKTPDISNIGLVWALTRETGIATAGSKNAIYLFKNASGNLAVGVPYSAEPSIDKRAGRGVFVASDGSIVQYRCTNPCPLSGFLDSVRERPAAEAVNSKAAWMGETATKISILLSYWATTLKSSKPVAPPKELEAHFGTTLLSRQALENLLSLYLISMVTLDPNQPEAFFHLGQLAQDKETAYAALRYARDTGLDAARLLELESAISSRF